MAQISQIALSGNRTQLAVCRSNGDVFLGSFSTTTFRWTFINLASVPRNNGSPYNWTSISSNFDGSILFICASTGEVFRSQNRGANWSSVTVTTNTNLSREWSFIHNDRNVNNLYICSTVDNNKRGEVFRSIDMGNTWTDVTPRQNDTKVNNNWTSVFCDYFNGHVVVLGHDTNTNNILWYSNSSNRTIAWKFFDNNTITKYPFVASNYFYLNRSANFTCQLVDIDRNFTERSFFSSTIPSTLFTGNFWRNSSTSPFIAQGNINTISPLGSQTGSMAISGPPYSNTQQTNYTLTAGSIDTLTAVSNIANAVLCDTNGNFLTFFSNNWYYQPDTNNATFSVGSIDCCFLHDSTETDVFTCIQGDINRVLLETDQYENPIIQSVFEKLKSSIYPNSIIDIIRYGLAAFLLSITLQQDIEDSINILVKQLEDKIINRIQFKELVKKIMEKSIIRTPEIYSKKLIKVDEAIVENKHILYS